MQPRYQIVVKFVDTIEVTRPDKGLELVVTKSTSTDDIENFNALLNSFQRNLPGLTFRDVFDRALEKEIDHLKAIAMARHPELAPKPMCHDNRFVFFELLETIRHVLPFKLDLNFKLETAATDGDKLIESVSGDASDKRESEMPSAIANHPLPNFFNFIALRFDDQKMPVEKANDYVTALRSQPLVETAYLRFEDINASSKPELDFMHDPQLEQQQHLKAAPYGIGVERIWDQPGSDGSSDGKRQVFIDLERGWDLNHEDLVDVVDGTAVPRVRWVGGGDGGMNPPAGSFNEAVSFSHGASVLGIVCAQNNSVGTLGIARNCDAQILSYYTGGDDQKRVDVNELSTVTQPIITALVAQMARIGGLLKPIETYTANNGGRFFRFRRPGAGITLLIESQAQLAANYEYRFPIEVYPEVFEAIRLATLVGVTVIEPAANGLHPDFDRPKRAFDLDTFEGSHTPFRGKWLNRSAGVRGGFMDSGAIMVAAGAVVSDDNIGQWKRWSKSNHGSRIDCFASGDRVYTGTFLKAEDDEEQRHDDYGLFGATSAASAIVAGAVVALQGMYVARYNVQPDPERVRKWLSNQSLGTASANPLVDCMGSMPDLERIVKSWT